MTVAGRRIEIRGIVQGVGFRPWVYRVAQEIGVSGRVRNDSQGVTIEAFGCDEVLDEFVGRLAARPPQAARIRELNWAPIPPEETCGFAIQQSRAGVGREVSIPADLATCPRCLSEIADARDRRYRYAFTNCTDCGPRFTIATAAPYDRARTSMAAFTMCAACRREYDNAGDRRFHAQPNACPVCGPRLRLVQPDGVEIATPDPLARTAAALRLGQIFCIKGIGGFHLACDALNELAVVELRRRKRREAKPLAVMVPDLAAARALALLNDEEATLLASVQRPIVLLRRHPSAPLAASIAPGNPFVGLMLPYSPLHHLLLAAAERPLVMTSANLSEEPIAYRNQDALRQLGAVADLFLLHDREIVTRCDDSIARVIGDHPVVLRRARGYVPQTISVTHAFGRPVLACGAQLKSTFCLGRERSAVLGPHIGDLDNLEALQSFEQAIARMERFLDIRPEVIACDLHPSYASSEYAARRPEAVKVAVQHHHAHIAAAMADNGLTAPVLGIAYDGTGFGTDGTAWGGEILVADFAGFERLATLRSIPLAGGEAAIRQVWRIALAVLDDAFDGAPPLERLPAFVDVPTASIDVVRRMIAAGFNAPRASGLGRYYDAVGSLVLGLTSSQFEGQVAMALDFAADPGETGSYLFDVVAAAAGVQTIDLRPALRALVADIMAGTPAAAVAARFQNTIIEATAATVAIVRERAEQIAGRGNLDVVLSGGCFQNARLALEIRRRVGVNTEVYLHRDVPPGDGGIALGQAVIADAVLQRVGWGEMGPNREIGWMSCA